MKEHTPAFIPTGHKSGDKILVVTESGQIDEKLESVVKSDLIGINRAVVFTTLADMRRADPEKAKGVVAIVFPKYISEIDHTDTYEFSGRSVLYVDQARTRLVRCGRW